MKKYLAFLLWLVFVVASKAAFTQNLFIFRHNGLYGYQNESGNIIVPAKFIIAMPFYGNRAAVVIDSLYGYIDKKGNMVVAEQFEDALAFSGRYASVRYKGKYGAIDSNGRFVVEPEYYALSFLVNDYFLFFVNDYNHGGIRKPGGKLVLEPEYTNFVFHDHNTWFFTDKNGKIGIFEIKEKFRLLFKPQFEVDGHEYNYSFSSKDLFIVKKAMWGVVNKKSETVIDFKIEDPERIRIYNHLIAVYDDNTGWMLHDLMGKKIAINKLIEAPFKQLGKISYLSDTHLPYLLLADDSNVVMIRDCAKPVAVDSPENHLTVIGSRWSFYDQSFKYYFTQRNFQMNEYGSNHSYGLMDNNYKLLLKPEYDHIEYITDFVGVIEKNRKYGFIDYNAGIVQDVKFDYYFTNEENKIWVGMADTLSDEYRWGLLDWDGSTLVPAVLKSFPHLINGQYYCIKKNGLYGLYNQKLELVMELKYRVIDYDENFLYVYDTNTGKLNFQQYDVFNVPEPQFDSMTYYKCSVAKVCQNALWGVIHDWNTDYLLKPQFKSMEECLVPFKKYRDYIARTGGDDCDPDFYFISDSCMNDFTLKLDQKRLDDWFGLEVIDFYEVGVEEPQLVKDVNEKYYRLGLADLINKKGDDYVENTDYDYYSDYWLSYYSCGNNLVSFTHCLNSSMYEQGYYDYSITNGVVSGDSVLNIKLEDVIETLPDTGNVDYYEDFEYYGDSRYNHLLFLNNPAFNNMLCRQLAMSLGEDVASMEGYTVPLTEYFEFTDSSMIFYLVYDANNYEDRFDYYRLEVGWDLLKPFIRKDCALRSLCDK